MVVVSSLSSVWLFVNPWTVAHWAPLSMDFPGKNTEVGCQFLLQGIFLTQGWNPYLLHCRQIYYSWASREAQEIYKVRNMKAIAEAIWVEWEVDLLWVWDPRTERNCIWIVVTLTCSNLGWVSKSIKVWVLSEASEPCFLNSKGSEWAQRKAASHQLLQPCTVKSRFLKLRVIRFFWTKGDAEVETGQMDGKNPKQDQNPEDAKHDPPVLSITSHSLGSAGIDSYPHRCEELTHWKRPWCWERLKAGEGDDRGWDGWMASPTRWTWVWVSSGSWWWTGRPGVHGVTESWTWLRDWTELSYPHLSVSTCLISCNFPHSSMMQ